MCYTSCRHRRFFVKKIRPPRTPEALDKLIGEFVRRHDFIAREQARLDAAIDQTIHRSVKRANKHVREIISIATVIDEALKKEREHLMGNATSVRLPHGKVAIKPPRGIFVDNEKLAVSELKRLKKSSKLPRAERQHIDACIRIIEEVNRIQLGKHPIIMSKMRHARKSTRNHVLITPKGRKKSINLRRGLTLHGPGGTS